MNDWRDRWTAAQLAQRVEQLSRELAQKLGWYETAGMLEDVTRALEELEEIHQEIP